LKKLRILVLMYEDFVAPASLDGLSEAEAHRIKTEFHVVATLRERGHDVRQLGISDDVRVIREIIEAWKPHIVFNLIEEFAGEAVYDHNVVSFLELLRVPYTGCNPRGMVITRDKAISKKLLIYHRIRVPPFFVVRRGRRVRRRIRLEFPLIVKSLIEESSLGIARASLVNDEERLAERVQFIHERIETDAIVESFIDGREIYVGDLGNDRLQVLPPLELCIGKGDPREPLIATAKVKHDPVYQKERGITVARPELTPEIERLIDRTARRAFRALELEGYARLDFRLTDSGKLYFLEANPNPEIAPNEEMAIAAEAAGLDYPALLEKILRLGLRR
jgi:D-alanine-D-alanine ligase